MEFNKSHIYYVSRDIENVKIPLGKNKFQAQNIIWSTLDVPRTHMPATAKEASCVFVTKTIIQEIINRTNLERMRMYR